MRILHLANHCDEVGNGIMNVAVDLACKQAERGHATAFASGGGAYVDLLRRHGVEHIAIVQEWRRPQTLPATLLGLRRLIRRFRPDIVHAHMMTGAVLARALRRRRGFRLVTTVHNEWQRSANLMGVGDRVIAVSDAVRRRMQARGVAVRKLRVVRNATLGSPRRPSTAAAHPVRLQHPAVVTLAGMYERKGIRDLISAFALLADRYPEAQLYLLGDGPDRAAFESLAAALPCRTRVHFLGFVREPRPYLAETDIFVLASHNDPSPLVIPEAREAGCAIVATAVGGIPEALDGGEAGILVPASNPAELAAAVDRLLAEPAERERWRQRAQSRLEWLRLDRAVDETLTIYNELLTSRCEAPLPAPLPSP
ncbi:MAG TPA: glycosyltransferase family 4 protein [Stellaceae bacterium]|nr:glycosyltransferase family 4 protein [Stellaceae bacterium]